MPIGPEYLHLVRPDLAPYDAFLYGRNSHDPKRKTRSVNDQLGDGRALCEQYGWPVKREFKDPGISASRHARRKRDDFEAMLAGIAAGECRIVVAWEASRYYRDLEVYVRLRNACFEAGVLLCYNGQLYDLSKREDRKATAMDAVSAEDEGEGIRDRNLRTTRRVANEGGPHGPAPLGYRHVYDPDTGELLERVADPKTVKLVNDMFQWAEEGEPLAAIARKLNGRGLTTRLGKTWNARTVHMMLRNRAYIGKRVHLGTVREGMWDGIVDEERFANVQAILDARVKGSGHDTSVKHLLSGIPYCSVHEPVTLKHEPTTRGREIYRCDNGDLSIQADAFQAYVEEGVLAWLSSDKAAAAFRSKPKDDKARKARVRLKTLQEQLEEARMKARTLRPDGKGMVLSIDSLSAIEAGLLPQIEKARAEAEEVKVPQLLRDLLSKPRPDIERAWNEQLTLHQRRTVLRLIVTIRLFKARAQGVKRIEPGRVTLSFFGEPGFTPMARPARSRA
ncbi:recombinase family protein [Streptomyces ipomoeae]|uniref:recombinase family protein n=1 Tax=Streptomyces ipomoeae TaxID=103232 RepID=UPI0011468F04|nr:recombinase family protein [Streptomyces ipomoeae]TQE35439.1 recombinase family protein [Streptomyces ipomoeae]